MARQVVVIGLGRFGSAVATTLHQLGYDVLAIDTDGRLVQQLLPHVTHAVQASGADREAMNEIGLREFDAAVVAISSNIEVSILTTLNLKELGMPYVISKASNDRHARDSLWDWSGQGRIPGTGDRHALGPRLRIAGGAGLYGHRHRLRDQPDPASRLVRRQIARRLGLAGQLQPDPDCDRAQGRSHHASQSKADDRA